MKRSSILIPMLAAACAAECAEPVKADESWPKWRKAMAEPNTIYDISDNTMADVKLSFPGGSSPAQFTCADGGPGTLANIFGYGGGVLMRGVGKYGALVFGSGGENFAANHTGALNLNGEAARYEVWQQPVYCLKAEPGAEFYWDPKTAEALPEGRKFPLCKFDRTKWDGKFPLAIGGWIYPAPVKYMEPADQVPLGSYRYDAHTYIPAEYTGIGTGVWFIPNVHFMAPGFYYGIDQALCADFWPSGKKKWYSHYQREDNKAWVRMPDPVPEWLAPSSFGGRTVRFSAKHKKVFVVGGTGDNEIGVLDISAGLARAAWSQKRFARKGSGHGGVGCQRAAISEGHPRDRVLLAWLSGPYSQTPTAINVLDLDDPANTIYAVKSQALKGSGECYGLHYIPKLNCFVSFGVWGDPLRAYCQKITLPDNLEDFESYKAEDIPLNLAPGVDLATSYTHGGMVQYVEKLDCIVFLAVRKPAKAFWIR